MRTSICASSVKGYILLEVTAAAAIIALSALSLSAALITTTQISATSRAVTQGRLLAQSHLQQAAAGVAPPHLYGNGLTSTLTIIEQDGNILWQVEIQGEHLIKPLRVVGGP